MNQKQFWYIVQRQDQACQIVSFATEQLETPEQKQWGHYPSEQEAISKKIGLIRAGKCKPE